MKPTAIVDLQLETGRGRASVYDTDEIQIMRVRLAPGEALPHHSANSNVLIVPLRGRVRVEQDNGDADEVSPGEAISVQFQMPMLVSNAGDEPLTFLVLKTPHPRVMGGRDRASAE